MKANKNTAANQVNYRYLQGVMKEMRAMGYVFNCKLNAKKEVLWSEYERVIAEQSKGYNEQQQQQQAKTEYRTPVEETKESNREILWETLRYRAEQKGFQGTEPAQIADFLIAHAHTTDAKTKRRWDAMAERLQLRVKL